MSTDQSNAYKLPATSRVEATPAFWHPSIIFEEWEMQLAEHVAKARLLSYGDPDEVETFGDQDRVEAMITGCLGEMAVRRIFNNPRREVIYAYGDPGYDAKIQDYTVDVKTSYTSEYRPDLIVNARSDLTADLYVLCHRFAPNKVRVIGYATQEEVRSREVQRFPEDRLAYVVPAEELWRVV